MVAREICYSEGGGEIIQKEKDPPGRHTSRHTENSAWNSDTRHEVTMMKRSTYFSVIPAGSAR